MPSFRLERLVEQFVGASVLFAFARRNLQFEHDPVLAHLDDR